MSAAALKNECGDGCFAIKFDSEETMERFLNRVRDLGSPFPNGGWNKVSPEKVRLISSKEVTSELLNSMTDSMFDDFESCVAEEPYEDYWTEFDTL